MKKYKLKKDFLYLKVWTILDIFKKKDEWTISITRYVISIKDWLIAEIVDSIHFVFDEYFEEITEEQNSIFNIKEWDIYYSICDDSDVESIIFENDSYDNKYIQSWNAFLTKEEATKEVERRKSIQRVKKFMYENNIKNKEFKPYEHNYIILYNALGKNFFTEYYKFFEITNDLWFFKTYDDCKKIINNCWNDLKVIFKLNIE